MTAVDGMTTYLVAYYYGGVLESVQQFPSTADPQDVANALADVHRRNVYVWRNLHADPFQPHTADGWGVPS